MIRIYRYRTIIDYCSNGLELVSLITNKCVTCRSSITFLLALEINVLLTSGCAKKKIPTLFPPPQSYKWLLSRDRVTWSTKQKSSWLSVLKD